MSQTKTQKRVHAGVQAEGPRSLWLWPAWSGGHSGGQVGGPALQLARTGTSFGRDEANDVVLDDGLVSRQHAVIRAQRGGGFVLRDLGSSNGSSVDGAPVGEAALGHGSVVRIGDSVWLALAEPPTRPVDDLGLRGDSQAMAELRAQIVRIAPISLPVLVHGPTGSGKELVAAALHSASGRRGRKVVVNCAALPRELVESALFGHRRGAFTSATTDAEGAFRAAQGGTLVLDEIGDMPIDLQPKLLRAIESGEITPVGASMAVPVDVRIVASTHVDLEQAVAGGRFREDLLARLGAIELDVPPLAARRDDILQLAAALLPEDCGAPRWSADVVEALLCWPWPRNVRELRNVMVRLGLAATPGAPWRLRDLPAAMRSPGNSAPSAAAHAATDAVDATPDVAAEDVGPPPDRETLQAWLDEAGGNVSELARRVGRNRKQIYRWMRRVGLQSDD